MDAKAAATAVVVGAGPAGLASAACLKRRGVEVTVLEASDALGASWRRHYDRLHLHTVKQHSALPGLPFAAEVPRYPSRADMVAYLDSYAAKFAIAPRTGEPVRRVRAAEGALEVESARAAYRADVVVMAAGLNRVPNPDELPGEARFRGTLLHSRAYTNGAPFRGQRALVVGIGNTGAEIALDLLEHGARVTIAARTPPPIVPRDFLGMPMQVTSIRMRKLPIAVGDRIGRVVSRLAFGDLTRYGLPRSLLGPLSSIYEAGRIPVIDVGTIGAIKRGEIAVRPGVARFTDDGVVFADGSSEGFDVAVLATGYRPGLAEIVEVAGALDRRGAPVDWRGGGAHPGLFFVGYENAATGLLREIGLQAEAVAAAVVTT